MPPALVAAGQALRTEFNLFFPDRKKGSDGWIGDPAHAARASDHNPDARGLVHALDVTADLGPGADMRDVIAHLVRRCRSGKERRFTYIIWDRTIWSARREWNPSRYGGDNPHTAHAHFSFSAVPALERDTSPYQLQEVPVALTAVDKKWIADQIAAGVAAGITAQLDAIGKAAGKGTHNQLLGKSDETIGQAIQQTAQIARASVVTGD